MRRACRPGGERTKEEVKSYKMGGRKAAWFYLAQKREN